MSFGGARRHATAEAVDPSSEGSEPGRLAVLVFGADEHDCALLLRELRRGGHDVEHARVDTEAALTRALREREWDVVISDHKVPRLDALRALALTRRRSEDLLFIIASATISDEDAAEAMRRGANDYVHKQNLGRLVPAIARELVAATNRRDAQAELERSHTALDASQAQLETLVDQLPAITWTTDVSLEFTSLRGSALEDVSLERDRVVGRRLRALFIDERTHDVAIDVHEQALAGRGSSFEFELDGRLFDTKVEPLVGVGNGVIGVIGLAMDVTEARKLESELHAAQRMEGIGRLAGGIAHDFNNVLTIVQTYSEFLEENFEPGDPALSDIGAIRDAARRASTLTGQLLAFSRRQVMQPRAVDLNEIITDMADMLRRMIGEDIALELNLAPTACVIDADPARLEQVFLNLAVNARDAMPRGGQIVVETRSDELSESGARAYHPSMAAGRYAVVTVRDTGCGMDDETRTRLFEPFFTTKGSGKGTGLGLSTTYGIVKQSNGFIWVDTVLGEGSTFTLQFPQIDAAPEPQHSGAPPRLEGGREDTILLVEDDTAVRLAAHRALERAGYRVMVAANGLEALEVARQHEGRIDLVITDVVMPGMAGDELVKQLIDVLPRVRTLYMSGYSEDQLAPHSVSQAPTRLLPKPFTPENLVATVREALES